jgi:hypothetical protein
MATNKVTTNVIDMSGNTGGLVWAKGTKAQRPGSPVAGDTRLNTSTSRLEFYNGTEWKRLAESSAGPTVDFLADFLVLSGGGGSGASGGSSRDNLGGGGGAGGLRTSFGSASGGPGSGGGSPAEAKTGIKTGTSYTVTVGAAGTAGAYTGSDNVPGSNGGDSVFSSITSLGGGGGGGRNANGLNGGCGSGAGMSTGYVGGTGSAFQGFNGGDSGNITSAGGGGTAANASAPSGGGAGLSVSITGAAVSYGPGGNGGSQGDNADPSHAVNSGGGGMAGRFNASGQSGIVIVRYPNTYTITVGSGLTSSTVTDGSDKVTSFTAGTDTISFS